MLTHWWNCIRYEWAFWKYMLAEPSIQSQIDGGKTREERLEEHRQYLDGTPKKEDFGL